jgi:hypothetical protein
MNEDEILELARQAIAEGESPDDVAQWIEDAGFSLEKMAAKPSGIKAVLAADRQKMGLRPGMSSREFADVAAPIASFGLAGPALGTAVKAIRGLRAVPNVPSPSGLVGANGSPIMVPGQQTSALQALRALVKTPAVRATLGATAIGEGIRRLF